MDRRILSTLIRLLVIALVLAGGYGLINQYYLSDRSLITHEPCAPPCWYGITPGVTTREEALDALHAIHFVRKSSIRLRNSPWKDAPGVQQERLSWRYHLYHTEGGRGGVIRIQDGVVVENIVQLKISLRLGHIIEQNGEPDLFNVIYQINHSLNHIIYFPEIGLMISGSSYDYKVIDNGEMVRAAISERIKIDSITYFPPMSVEDYYQTVWGLSPEEAREWAEWLEPWPGLGATVELERSPVRKAR